MSSSRYWELTVEIPEEACEGLGNFAWELGALGVVEEELPGGRPRLRAFFPKPLVARAIEESARESPGGLRELGFPGAGEPGVVALASQDWADSWRAHFRPLPVGKRLLIAPPWDRPRANGRVVITIEPGRAFGTGQHPSTLGCLERLESLLAGVVPSRLIDLGTGSGVLAIAAARLGGGRVLAVDDEPHALACAMANAARNRRCDRARCGLGDGRVVFDRAESRHLGRVLRLKPGDTVIAADGAGHDFTVRLEDVGETVTGSVLGVATRDAESPLRITLVQSVPKGDKMEAIVRAATELGVGRVVPVTSERTIVRLEPGRWRERARRWQRVAKEAAKQCGRAVVPPVDVPRPLAEFLALDEPAELRLCLWEGAAAQGQGGGQALPFGTTLAQSLPPTLPVGARVHLLIGPEGGLSRQEVERGRAAGWRVIGVGPRILRTETAGPAIIAVLQSKFGDLD